MTTTTEPWRAAYDVWLNAPAQPGEGPITGVSPKNMYEALERASRACFRAGYLAREAEGGALDRGYYPQVDGTPEQFAAWKERVALAAQQPQRTSGDQS